MLHINKELINVNIDVIVVLFKINIAESKTNSFGESVTKKWYQGTSMPCLIDRSRNVMTKDMTVNVEQDSEFRFLRQECIDRNLFPEVGDIILFDNLYYEIHQLNSTQLISGQTEYNHSIIASTHLTRTSGLQLEPPVV